MPIRLRSLALSIVILGGTAAADHPPETDRVSVTVVDEKGNPVPGAEVQPFGLRTRKERGSHYTNQRAKIVTTDNQGIAEVDYPRYVVEKMETGTLSLTVSHPDFVKYRKDHELDSPIEVTLDPGRRLQVAALDPATGKRLTSGLYGLQNGFKSDITWKARDDGMLVSSPVTNETKTVLLVCLREGQPTLFSELIDLAKNPAGDVELGDVEMRMGRRIRGRLSDAVPRPVKNGNVGLYFVIAQNERPPRDDIIKWSDTREIQPDGTFIFDSVPPDTMVEAIADCNGWVSASASAEQMEKTFWNVANRERAEQLRAIRVVAQQFPADNRGPIEIEMEQTATCQFNVTDEDGNPVANAELMMYPNFTWSAGGNQMVGTYSRSAELLGLNEAELTARWKKKWDDGKTFKYRSFTDKNGVATMESLPGKRNITIDVTHNDFELPADNNRLRRGENIEITPGDTFEVELKLQKKGTQVLGE